MAVWRDINDPGGFFRPEEPEKTSDAKDQPIVEKKPKAEPEAQLSDPQWAEGSDGFAFNKKVKVSVKVDYLKATSRKRVSFELFVESDGEQEDLKQNADGFEKDGRAEAEITLYYGDKYSERLSNDPSATCTYIFRAIHSTGGKPVESEPLEMPHDSAPSNGTFKVSLSMDPARADADDDAFILFSTDPNASYSKALTVKDDKIKGDDCIELEFGDLIEGLNYSLKVLPGNTEKGYLLFNEKPYKEIV